MACPPQAKKNLNPQRSLDTSLRCKAASRNLAIFRAEGGKKDSHLPPGVPAGIKAGATAQGG